MKFFKKILPFIFISLMFFGGTGHALAGEREDIISTFERIAPSVGALYAQQENGNITFLCSATAVGHEEEKTIILTANHCLQKGVSYLINFGDNRLRKLLVWKIPHYEADKNNYPRIYNEPETDMALFLMDGTDVPVVPLAGENEKTKSGGKIVMIGYPLGVTKINYEGIIAGYFDRLGSDIYNYLMLQIFASSGSSGSAVIDVNTGKVVGVLVAAKSAYAGLPVIFATPIDYIKHLMQVREQNVETKPIYYPNPDGDN